MIAVLGLVVATPALGWLAWERSYPCWRFSNATWCGHFCDDDPCACPARHETPDPDGGGPGCAD